MNNPYTPMGFGGYLAGAAQQAPMTQPMASAAGPSQAQQAQPNQPQAGAPAQDPLAMLMALLGQTQPQNNGLKDILSAIKPDPLGTVARSNSRPGGFTPQADWDAWGPPPGQTPQIGPGQYIGMSPGGWQYPGDLR